MNDKVKKVTMSNTKKEMMDVVKQMSQILEEKEATMLDPEKIKLKAKSKDTIRKVNEIVLTDPNTLIHNLKLSINKELIAISEKLEEETSKYKELEDAIFLKKSELKDVYGIEEQAASLVVLIESQKVLRQNFIDEMDKSKNDWNKERKVIYERSKEQDEQTRTERKREEEQFIYDRDRNREIDKNKFTDEMTELLKELRYNKETFDEQCQTISKELDNREIAVSTKEESIEKLQTLVDSFPDVLRKAENATKAKVETRLQNSYEQNKALLKMGFDGEINLFKSKVESLEKIVADQSKQIEKLESQQEKAYAQVQDIANKAVSGASDRPQNLTIQSQESKSK